MDLTKQENRHAAVDALCDDGCSFPVAIDYLTKAKRGALESIARIELAIERSSSRKEA